jgi:mannitol/fructose-specific phosphotransferase system IIA component (Ntr-type)
MLNAITTRENKMTTIILPGVAVPHGYCNTVHGIIGAIGFSRGGIEFDQECRDPVHLFFMLLMDESSCEKHLQVLGRLLEMINSAPLSEIRGIETSQEIYELLSRY